MSHRAPKIGLQAPRAAEPALRDTEIKTISLNLRASFEEVFL